MLPMQVLSLVRELDPTCHSEVERSRAITKNQFSQISNFFKKQLYVKKSIHKYLFSTYKASMSFPGGSDGKESACNAGHLGSILGLGRYPGEENGYPYQYFCLENPMDRGAWLATVRRIAKSWTQLSDFHFLPSSFPLSLNISYF